MKTAPSTPNKLDQIVFQSMFLTLKNNQQTVAAGLGCPNNQKDSSPMEILTLRPLLHRRPARFSPRHTHSIGLVFLAQHYTSTPI